MAKLKKKKQVEPPDAVDAADTSSQVVCAEEAAKRKRLRKEKKAAAKAAEASAVEDVPDTAELLAAPKKRKRRADQDAKVDVVEEAGEKTKAHPPGATYKVCVGGLPWTCTEDILRKDFTECGEVSEVTLLTTKHGAEVRSRGVAFISFATETGLLAALKYHGEEYGGRVIKVSRAVEREDKGKGKGKGKEKSKPRAPSGEKPENCTSILAKSLSGDVTEDDLYALFKNCGTGGATNVRILLATGVGKRLAFVDFDDTDAVDQAIKLHGSQLKNGFVHLGYSMPRAHKIQKKRETDNKQA